ncbi:DUF2624 domain-containing protein [Pseudobacillus wudalianchiensis]|nr:DUF2624 domain-containing protein [Bacillus wudalianchiensis]
MKFLQNIINQKAQMMTGDELLKYAKGLDIPLKREEAERVASLLRSRRIDLFNEQERVNLLREIAAITNKQTADKLNKLLKTFLQ